ncbi:Methionyl-tRNA formyltransferase [hydrothermal vent metagenome]|uniref:methionyl-tRNA formyltransferase n=1 Tax=hydrothermal vent metagenome TaxID=652676 RepID=A0A3B0UZD0_9ZZZZ
MKKIVFMGTPEFAVPVLQTLIDTQNVVGVVTQPDRPAGRGKRLRASPVKVAAEAANVPVYQPKSLRSEAAAQPLRDWQPDMIIVAAFGQILRPHVLDLPPHGCLNIHASLLPRWRGASPIQHAILAGDAETGICLMQMDVGLDTGPVFTCASTPISVTETAVSLHDRLATLGAELLATHLDNILAGKLAATPQDDEQSTYAPMIEKEDGRLDWQQTSIALDRRIRAMTPWPGAFTTWQGKMLKIKQAAVANGRLPTGNPGQVVAFASNEHEEGAVVLTSEGGLLLQEIQLAGKRTTAVADFLRGHSHFVGSQFDVG